MKYSTWINADEHIVALSGMLTFKDLSDLHNLQENLGSSPRTKTCVLDLSDVRFVDSSVLGMFISLRAQLKEKDISIVLRNPKDKVLKVLTACKYDELFTIETKD